MEDAQVGSLNVSINNVSHKLSLQVGQSTTWCQCPVWGRVTRPVLIMMSAATSVITGPGLTTLTMRHVSSSAGGAAVKPASSGKMTRTGQLAEEEDGSVISNTNF